MCIHFATRQAAIQNLTANGWRQIASGNFISRDGSCAACITPRFDEVVLVQYWEVGT